jgi:predicted MPP superfamily phosphohydrolase
MLSGHTHGGQVELPFIGHGYFAPVRDHRFISGRYDWEGRQLFITRGVGSLRGIRFNCRPEVSLLTLA